jgi:hypothetical protein
VLGKSFHKKINIFCAVCKKDKFFYAKKDFAPDIFVFFTGDTKVSIFHEIWRAHIEYRDVPVIFFNSLKCFSRWQEHMLPCAKLNFHDESTHTLETSIEIFYKNGTVYKSFNQIENDINGYAYTRTQNTINSLSNTQ